MAKDDYHVIAFRILAYLYECLRRGEKPDLRSFRHTDESFEEIPDSYWQYIIKHLFADGYIEGVRIGTVVGTEEQIDTKGIAITPKGIEYLETDSSMGRAVKFLKSIGAVVPGMIEITKHFI